MKAFKIMLVLILGMGLLAQEEFFFNFENGEIGKVPEDFVAAQTGGRGTLTQWKIVKDSTAPSGEKVVFAIPNPKTNHGACFNVLIYQKAQLKDLDISVSIKPVSGKEDQGGGVLWRAKDENNYYVVRWNPLEKNFRLYYVKDGVRHFLRSSRLYADPNKWHVIKVLHKGKDIKCYFDGELKIHYVSSIFTQPGKFGLWTKADASSRFDNLQVKEVK